MSKIAVISDTHGSIENIRMFLPRLKGVDALYHLGDHAEDAPDLARILNCGFVSVCGTCDPFSVSPEKYVVNWHGKRILLLHGHTVFGRQHLFYAAKQENCDAVLFGHSHVASIETYEGVLMVNPGSLSRPRGGKGPSVALLTLTDEALNAELLF